MFSKRIIGLTAAAALAALTLLGIAAGSRSVRADEHDRAQRLRESGEIQSLESIIEKAQKAHPGRLIETELEQLLGRYIYEIELIDEQGIVWELKYDAVTGELLRKEQED